MINLSLRPYNPSKAIDKNNLLKLPIPKMGFVP